MILWFRSESPRANHARGKRPHKVKVVIEAGVFISFRAVPRGRVSRALPGREIQTGALPAARRVPESYRGSPCDSRDDDRRVHRSDHRRETRAPPL